MEGIRFNLMSRRRSNNAINLFEFQGYCRGEDHMLVNLDGDGGTRNGEVLITKWQ